MANSSNPNDRWYFTKEQLEGTPSRKCGFDSHKELSNRQQAANFIQDMGQRLKVSQLCINTAIVYMHRFYVFHSFTHFPWHQMAAAALFLAAKVEEQPRKLEYVIRVANICKNNRDTTIDVTSERYISQSQDLVFNENVLLQTLGFDVAIDHPHTHVVRCCHLVRASKDLAQTSYFMASNSLHLTTMCIQYKPTVVACFCILVACKWSNWEIPLSYEKKEWYSYVDPTVTAELLQQLTEEFLVIFEKCPSRLKEKIMAIGDNISHIPTHHIISPFDSEPRKIIKDEKDAHSHRSSSGMDDPQKHRSNRPHEMGSSNQHQRERERERDRNSRERLPHPQKPNIGSTSSSNMNSSGSSSSGQLKSSHSSHHRPPIDPKMKPPSRPSSIPYPQPKDILREAASRDSPFGLAREYPKDSHAPRTDKDPKRDYHVKNNNQTEVTSASTYAEHRLNMQAEKMNYDKQRVDPNGRPRADPTKVPTAPTRRDESKSHLENIKKHLSATTHDKNGSYLNKPISTNSHEVSKSVPKQTVVPAVPPAKVGVANTNSYAPPVSSDVKVKQEPVTPKEKVPTPPVIKRPSLFSPEKTPPHRQSNVPTNNASEDVLLSPLISPMQIKRERNYSSSSEPELRPVMKKIDQVEGFENLIRDSTIGITKMGQTPDAVKVKNEILSPDIKKEPVESNGDTKPNSNLSNHNRPPPVNGLETTDPAVISNLLKEASTVSHLPSVVPIDTSNQDPTDKNQNHFHHKSKKKNKDKHKHKDKSKDDKDKKKKHKDKDRERHKHKDPVPEVPPQIESLKLKIPKDKIIPVEVSQPPLQGLKIKIPKNKINTENISELSQSTAPIVQPPPPQPSLGGIKLTIPKDKINNFVNLESGASRKRERDRSSPEGQRSKVPKTSSKDAKTNGRYSSSNKVSAGVVSDSRSTQSHAGFMPNPDSTNYQMFSAPPPPPPPPPAMYFYNQMPPPPHPMPNMNVPPPYMYPNPYYPQGYMYQGGMYSHPPPMQPPVMHSSGSIPPLPTDAPPQAPPPPPE